MNNNNAAAAPGIDLPAGWKIERAGERLRVLHPDGGVSEWTGRPTSNGSGMYDLCMALIDASSKGDTHPDDAAVDAFATAMKAKLADARAKGRGGWNSDEPGMQQRLSDMLRDHVEKGDPRDVANFCMFLHQRGEGISPKGGSDELKVWGTQRPNSLPKLFGARHIAELNWFADEADLICMQVIERIRATSAEEGKT